MRFREVLINEGKEERPYLCFNILTVWWVEPCNVSLMVSTPGRTPIWNRGGCSSEILNLTLKETIWVWHEQILTPKRDCLKEKKKKKRK